jgi:predicted NBD/HSP70 family sugar kinase
MSAHDPSHRPAPAAARGTLHSTSYVRAANAAQIVRLLRDHGAMSRAELVRASGLTKPTVMAIVRSLLRDGIAIESGTRPGAERGGRPGSLVWFNSKARTAVAARVGLGLELTHVTAAGAVLAEESFSPAWDPDPLLELVVREVRRLTGASGALGSVALAVPGFIDHRVGTVTFPPYGWDRVPMQPTLTAGLGVPVRLLSLPAATLVGEIISDAAAQHDDAVLVYLAQGIGAGILSRGHLLLGAGGAVGELGHCPVSSGLSCPCGRQGCLETVAAGWAIRARATALLGPGFAHADLAQLEELHDPRIDDVLSTAAAALGAATAWLINLLDPSIVILADTSFARGADAFFETFEQSTRRYAVSAAVKIVRGAPEAQPRGTIQCALELLPEPLCPRRSLCA